MNDQDRRTGRTEKMLTHVIDFCAANTDEKVYVIAHNHQYARDLCDRLIGMALERGLPRLQERGSRLLIVNRNEIEFMGWDRFNSPQIRCERPENVHIDHFVWEERLMSKKEIEKVMNAKIKPSGGKCHVFSTRRHKW